MNRPIPSDAASPHRQQKMHACCGSMPAPAAQAAQAADLLRGGRTKQKTPPRRGKSRQRRPRRRPPGALPHRQNGLPDRGTPDPQPSGSHARDCASRLQSDGPGARRFTTVSAKRHDRRGTRQPGYGPQPPGSGHPGRGIAARPECQDEGIAGDQRRRCDRRRGAGLDHRTNFRPVMILAALSILSAGLPTLKKAGSPSETGRSTSIF